MALSKAAMFEFRAGDEPTLSGASTCEMSDEDAQSSAPEEDTHSNPCDDQQEDYYTFLREMAGSFEAGCEDGSEAGSELGVSDEEAAAADVEPTDSPQPRGRARSCALTADELDGWLAEEEGEPEPGPPAAPNAGAPSSSAAAPGPRPQTAAAEGAGASECGGRSDEAPNGDEIATLPGDHGLPIEDGYDVAPAIRDFAARRQGDLTQHVREDVQEAIHLKRQQAQSLRAPAGNPRSEPHLRAHYARVRGELLMQVRHLEAWLAQFEEAVRRGATPLPLGHVAAARCAAQRAHAHGAKAAHPPAVVFQESLRGRCAGARGVPAQ